MVSLESLSVCTVTEILLFKCESFERFVVAGSCGSCYAFSSMGMLEARLRVASNNTVRVTLSPQDVVECSQYSQGW